MMYKLVPGYYMKFVATNFVELNTLSSNISVLADNNTIIYNDICLTKKAPVIAGAFCINHF